MKLEKKQIQDIEEFTKLAEKLVGNKIIHTNDVDKISNKLDMILAQLCVDKTYFKRLK